jgi:hypothetical protein
MITPRHESATESGQLVDPQSTTNAFVASAVSGPAGAKVVEPNGAYRADDTRASGTTGEEHVWESRYSARNFLVRTVVAAAITVIWAVVAFDVWGLRWSQYRFLATWLGFAMLAYWAYLGYRLIRAQQSHHYRLTTRRLFVSNGFIRRRVDQIELIRIKDLFLQQAMFDQWLDVGTVVVVSSEQTLPKAALLGVDHPQVVMDLIWDHARREQDRKTTAIEQV